MSLGLRGFIEYLINEIKRQDIVGTNHNINQIEENVINVIWDAYEKWEEE